MANHLCGPPVSKSCITRSVLSDGSNSEGSNGQSKLKGLYVSIGVGYVMGFGGMVAPLFFIRSWRYAYYQKLDHVGRKLYLLWASISSPHLLTSFPQARWFLKDLNSSAMSQVCNLTWPPCPANGSFDSLALMSSTHDQIMMFDACNFFM
ncbi:hypothetical protein V6N11_079758 [Hibiscus sabdariffa]|uniref:Uncharacterized protein n=1 Tax=Hibiscus sabdariffa TaxID=183260 RepID=A0ABR2RWE8_9ROSI